MKVIKRQYDRVREKLRTQLYRVSKKIKGDGCSRELTNQDITLSLYQVSSREPMEESEREAIEERVDKLLCKLNKQQMKVISLYYFDGMTLKEISTKLDYSTTKTWELLQEALRVMRED